MSHTYDGPLRFGLFHAPFHSKRLDPTYALERDLLLTEHLDRLGFEEIWYGEHHSGGMKARTVVRILRVRVDAAASDDFQKYQ